LDFEGNGWIIIWAMAWNIAQAIMPREVSQYLGVEITRSILSVGKEDKILFIVN